MAQQNINGRVLGFKAGADLSAKINYLCKLDTVETQVVLATADAVCVGVINNKPTLGQAVTVAIGETVKVILGGTVAVGDYIVSDANGKAVVRVAEVNVFGIALQAGVAGDTVEVLVEKKKI